MDQLAAMADDLVHRKVAVIAGTSAPGALAARHSTERGGRAEATGVAARAGPHGDCHGAARPSGKSYYREVIE